MTTKQFQRYDTGKIIFSEDDRGDCAYIIESGRVEIFVMSDDERVTLTTLGPGEIFGEMSVIDGSPRSASAMALEACELVVVSSEQISERIGESDPIVRLLISMLLKRMRSTNLSAKHHHQTPSGHLPTTVVESLESTLPTLSREDVIEKMKLETELKQALTASEFTLFYQPIMDLETRQLAGFEALIRWHSPSRGLIRPDIFMGIAEETSLIVPIGRWVIEQGAQAIAELDRRLAKLSRGDFKPFVSVNVSGRQFHDANFLSHLQQTLAKVGVAPERMKIEVTERVFMEGPAASHTINKCRELGFPVSLDDFGTGYSCLSYLSQFKVDNLKVDQSFVRQILKDENTRVITKAIIDMANGLGLPVIAEGIETEEWLQALIAMNCRYGQGYLFSKPVPFQDAWNYLAQSLEGQKAS